MHCHVRDDAAAKEEEGEIALELGGKEALNVSNPTLLSFLSIFPNCLSLSFPLISSLLVS